MVVRQEAAYEARDFDFLGGGHDARGGGHFVRGGAVLERFGEWRSVGLSEAGWSGGR
jgi:hypothetical protein